MSRVIRLDIVLREAVATPYRDLVTRSTGAAVRARVITVLRDSPAGDAHLDFSEVGVIDFSCADEVVAKLLLALGELQVPRLMLRGVRDDHADAIGHALERYDRLIVAFPAESTEPRLLGAAPDDWHAAFGAVARMGRSGAHPIATALQWHAERTLSALRGLTAQRCVVAHPDATWALGAVA